MSTASLTAPGAEALERRLTAWPCPHGMDKAPETAMGQREQEREGSPGACIPGMA